jgi:hypothetical protein
MKQCDAAINPDDGETRCFKDRRLKLTSKVRRRFVRLTVKRPAKFSTGGRIYTGVITDESHGGVFVEAKGVFFQGNRVKLTYVDKNLFEVTHDGKIVRIEPNGIAIEFHRPRSAE